MAQENRLGIYYGWGAGSAGWDAQMDANLLKLATFARSSVISKTVNTPPVSPTDGDAYIIPAGANGAWSGHSGKIAVWRNNVSLWELYNPVRGPLFLVEAEGQFYTYSGTAWGVFGGGGGGGGGGGIIALADGSTATTQAQGDSTSKVATDEFVTVGLADLNDNLSTLLLDTAKRIPYNGATFVRPSDINFVYYGVLGGTQTSFLWNFPDGVDMVMALMWGPGGTGGVAASPDTTILYNSVTYRAKAAVGQTGGTGGVGDFKVAGWNGSPSSASALGANGLFGVGMGGDNQVATARGWAAGSGGSAPGKIAGRAGGGSGEFVLKRIARVPGLDFITLTPGKNNSGGGNGLIAMIF